MNRPPSVEAAPKKRGRPPQKKIDEIEPDVEPVEDEDEQEIDVPRMDVDDVLITVPMGQMPSGYTSDLCYVKSMTQAQRITLRRVLNGLTEREAKLANGKWVKTGQDAVKWILENLLES